MVNIILSYYMSLDTTFGTGGIVTTELSNTYSLIFSLAIQSDGKIVAGGTSDIEGTISFVLARYYADVIPVNNICFVEGSMVATDQGAVAIEKITPYHTIGRKPVLQITKTISVDKTLVYMKKNALGFNTPYRETIVSNQHKLYYNLRWYYASELINHKTIVSIPYQGQYLYNVLLDTHTTMNVNGLTVETLDPSHYLAMIYTSELSEVEKNGKINEMNLMVYC